MGVPRGMEKQGLFGQTPAAGFSAMLTIAKTVPCKNGLQEAACLFLP